MSKELELKPCPFCGAPAKLEELGDHHGDFYNLGCSVKKCMAHNIVYTESEIPVSSAVATWNARPGEDAGRTLGRREMKEKAKEKAMLRAFNQNLDGYPREDREGLYAYGKEVAASIIDAIEAIPEEVS